MEVENKTFGREKRIESQQCWFPAECCANNWPAATGRCGGQGRWHHNKGHQESGENKWHYPRTGDIRSYQWQCYDRDNNRLNKMNSEHVTFCQNRWTQNKWDNSRWNQVISAEIKREHVKKWHFVRTGDNIRSYQWHYQVYSTMGNELCVASGGCPNKVPKDPPRTTLGISSPRWTFC